MDQATSDFNVPSSAAGMLAEMARIYKYDLSAFEALLWQTQVFDDFPDEVVMRALMEHMMGNGPDAKFMPKPGAIKNRLVHTPGFAEIHAAVKVGSPYIAPNISDPALIEAIQMMGGWAQVCAEMPDNRESPIDYDRYTKRFEAAIGAARNKVNIHGHSPAPLAAIGQRKTLAIGHSATPVALPAPVEEAQTEQAQLPAPQTADDLAAASRLILRQKA